MSAPVPDRNAASVPPARAARLAAGLSDRDAAQRARISVPYLRRAERHGAPYGLARRLAAIYGCKIDLFQPPKADPARRSASVPAS